ncbi:Membrane domain of glycerophosphoryl diester phosphodiesterase [Streptomyces sp. yr375]|uniref:glycerophosphoryl diester phosphodiesterase membrane domain-containing protein n=1 Tax=Streptomyces sp. yr375 TaxID=1761906 RepID=UPI0008B34FBC|nr:glycerophosphoryl diester phosphodiesterase membrane domain-containing protein [Streptomyces sp. yr375]SES49813.1 Membrane domain of glycerophosphoryl diester phosphodiesterase [Streptomyces sp. yr375]
MNDTPGWASPGSAPSDGQEPGASHPAEPADRPTGPQPADQPGANPQSPGTKWSKEQPPPGQWSAPTGPQNPGQTPPPGPGWSTHPPAGPGAGHPGGPAGPTGNGGYGRQAGPSGYGGYGAPGGWGAGWGGPPPAAKPGVIPLRPLGVGEILDGAVATMRTYWRTVLGISLTVAVVTQVCVVLLQGLVLDGVTNTAALGDPSATTDEQLNAMSDALRASGPVLLITLLGTITATALLTAVTSRAVLGKPVTLREAWRDARPQVPRLFGLIFLVLLITAGAAFACLLPGALVNAAGSTAGGDALTAFGVLGSLVLVLWLLVRFSLASPALMLEKQGIKKALGRSAKLTRGSWWRVLGIELLALIISNIIAMIVVVPFVFVGATLTDGGVGGVVETGGDFGWAYLIVSGVGSVIGSMVTFPIVAGVFVLLYIDQRIRREALDLDLARAAGLQDYGSPAPGTTTPGS